MDSQGGCFFSSWVPGERWASPWSPWMKDNFLFSPHCNSNHRPSRTVSLPTPCFTGERNLVSSSCWVNVRMLGLAPSFRKHSPPPPRTGPHTDGLLATCWASPQISSLSQMVFTRKQTFKTWAEPSPRKTVRAGRPRSRSRGRQKLEGCAVSQADRALESSGAAQPQCGRPVNNYPWTTSNALLIRTLFPINFHIFVHRSPFTIQVKPWSGSVHWLLYVLGYALHICESSFYRAERRCVCLPSRIYPWLWELKLNENWPAHLLFEVSVTLIPKTDKDSTRKETTGCILF